MGKNKKRICLALGFVQAEDAITKIIESKHRDEYEIVQNVRSKEVLYDTIKKEKYDVIILREDLSGNVDLIEIFKTIRTSSSNTQVILFMNKRSNGDPFYIELFLFNIYDFVVLPNIKLEEVFGFLEKPRQFKDITNYLPLRAERVRNLIIEANKDLKAPIKLDENGDIDEVLDINLNKDKKTEPEVVIKEVIKYIEKPIVREIIKEVPVPMPMPALDPISAVTEEPKKEIEEEKIEDIKTENLEIKAEILSPESSEPIKEELPQEESAQQIIKENKEELVVNSIPIEDEIVSDEEDDI